jgi:uncharacterized protein
VTEFFGFDLMDNQLLAALFIFVAATLYSSVGHGGASAYLAAMALLGINAVTMRPTILALNVMVATISFASFARRRYFSWELFWPLALASVPCAWLGGSVILPEMIYKKIIGLVLIFAAYRLWKPATAGTVQNATLSRSGAAGLGSGIGFLSGLTGVGGGIFLSPVLILKGWADAKTASAVAAPFIVVNSLAGLLALKSKPHALSPSLGLWAVAAIAGGALGSYLGSKKLGVPGLKRMLAVVLLVASVKLLFF